MGNRRIKLVGVSREDRERLWALHLSSMGPHTSTELLGGIRPTIYGEGGRIKYWSERDNAYVEKKDL